MFRDNDVDTLMRLGLTLLQAKAYLTLSTLGSATMGSLSKASSVARQDIYRIMPGLQKMGIVQKMVATPATYSALPLKEGLSLLLQQKQEEYTNLQKRAFALVSDLRETKKRKTPNVDEDGQFMIIHDQTLLFQKFEKFNKLARKSIDVSNVWPEMKWLLSLCNCKSDLFTEAMGRGVRIRILSEDRGADSAVDKNIIGMSRNPLFCVKFVPAPIPLKLVLYDREEVYTSISTSPETDLPMLWSNNPNLVWVVQNQFDEMWEKATPFTPNKKAQLVKPKK